MRSFSIDAEIYYLPLKVLISKTGAKNKIMLKINWYH
jgi:hypothetical protein